MDQVLAALGVYTFLYLFLWEWMDAKQLLIGAAGLAHGLVGYGGSYYYHRVVPDVHRYIRWHALGWHVAFPLWTVVLGLYSFSRATPEENRWYPDPLWSFLCPLVALVVLNVVQASRGCG